MDIFHLFQVEFLWIFVLVDSCSFHLLVQFPYVALLLLFEYASFCLDCIIPSCCAFLYVLMAE